MPVNISFINTRKYFDQPVSIAPLITFRIIFGSLMFFSILRFWWRGWITTLYVLPKFHFTYTGFAWVQPLGNTGMHLVFMLLLLATLFIIIGLFYRVATIIFFTGFSYIELIDVTTYLNHYYFISLAAFIMIWLPANGSYSIDARLRPGIKRHYVPAWCINILRFQVAVVYIFAGLAKLQPDWLISALPMKIWLPAKTHLPIIGKYLYQSWVAYLFSWFGAVYDLFIVFFLLNKKTRPVAYVFVVVFHLATAIFFPAIGMFPYVMIASSLIFFSGAFHEKLLQYLPLFRRTAVTNEQYDQPVIQQELNPHQAMKDNMADLKLPGNYYRWLVAASLSVYMFLQLVIPLRFLLYPGRLFWHEEGYRFSWRVMLMEKSGSAYFTIRDRINHQSFEVNNVVFLTALQEKMMSTQPDMILKYAHFLAAEYKRRGVQNPEVHGEIYVSLNGQRSRLFIDSTVDLASKPLSWKHYDWVLP